MKNRKQAEKTSQDKGALSAFLFPDNRDNGESCVMCGAAVPEGRQVCPSCQAKFFSADREILIPPKVGKTALASDAWIESKKEGLI